MMGAREWPALTAQAAQEQLCAPGALGTRFNARITGVLGEPYQ